MTLVDQGDRDAVAAVRVRRPVSAPLASVVIPAYNEQDTIVATLRALTATATAAEFEIVVVCNGCTDATAERARSFTGVEVVEIEQASKIAALREGDRVASHFPRLYLDGDVSLSTDAARALVAALAQDGSMVAGLPGVVDATCCTRPVRLFYDFRQRLPVFRRGIIGAGVYAMSAEARARFGEWPELWGDDQFVLRFFPDRERRTVTDHRSMVVPPRDLRGVIRRGVRVRIGNAQLSRGTDRWSLPPPQAGFPEAAREAVRTPRGWLGMLVFTMVTSIIRLRTLVLRGSGDWITSSPALATGTVAVPSTPSKDNMQPLAGRRSLAAVIVTFNAEDVLPPLLTSLRRTVRDLPHTIIVVDNGSTDGTRELLSQQPDVITHHQTNTGFAHGLNQGIELAPSGADLLVLNADVVLEPDAIGLMLDALDETGDVAAVVPTLRAADGRVLSSLRREPSVARTSSEVLLGGRRAGRAGEAYRPTIDRGRQEVDWATGAVMLLRRTALEQVGRFDETFFLYSEETDFCLRARDAGWRIMCEPRAVAVHAGGGMSHDPTLWALRAVNRVRLYARRSRPSRTWMFRATSVAFEARRLAMGRHVSGLALRSLLRRDLDATAQLLACRLGRDPAVGGGPRTEMRGGSQWVR